MSCSLAAAMAAFEPVFPLGVAFSGGADSTALLYACAQRWPGQVVALHVNHGLQPAALDFERHCQAVCTDLQLELRVARTDARHQPGQSPEDAARVARYRALEALALAGTGLGPVQTVALAQHADDQVETMLLALSRGAGLAGLSGMRSRWRRGNVGYCRPWLQVGADDIRQWLAEQGIPHVQDPSNTDECFTRNRLRARVLPALAQACPQFRDTFARTASHAAQAVELLDTLAADDLRAVLRSHDGLPRIRGLQQLSAPRQSNALRYWLKSGFGVIPSAAQLAELQHQLAACVTRAHQLHMKVGQGFVQRRGEVVAWYNPDVLLHTS